MQKVLSIFIAGILTVSLAGCRQECGEKMEDYTEGIKENVSSEEGAMKIIITVGEETFSGELYHNDTAEAFAKQLPMTLVMKELNGNEKYSFLSESFPTDPRVLEQIRQGDLMLYGSDCLVLFYETFSSSYSYTALGHVDDSEGLSQTLESGNVQVSFSLE